MTKYEPQPDKVLIVSLYILQTLEEKHPELLKDIVRDEDGMIDEAMVYVTDLGAWFRALVSKMAKVYPTPSVTTIKKNYNAK